MKPYEFNVTYEYMFAYTTSILNNYKMFILPGVSNIFYEDPHAGATSQINGKN